MLYYYGHNLNSPGTMAVYENDALTVLNV